MKYGSQRAKKRFDLKAALKYSSIVGWELGALICGGFVPLQLWILGETDINLFGDHAISLQNLGLWVFGFGIAAFFAHGFALLSVSVKKEKLKIAVLSVYIAHLFFMLFVVIFATIRVDVVDYYGQQMWNSAEMSTIHLLQTYFNCCSYSTEDTNFAAAAACNAAKKDDLSLSCSDQFRLLDLTSSDLQKFNTPLILTILMLSLLGLLDIWMLILTVIWIRTDSNVGSVSLQPSPTDHFKSSVYTISRSNSTVSTSLSATTNSSTPKTLPKTPKETVYQTSQSDQDVSKDSEGCWSKLMKLFGKLGGLVSSSIQNFFQWAGIKTAENPISFISLSIIIAVSLTSGIIQQRRLSRGADLLLPHDSELRDQLETMYRSFPFAFRDSSILFVQKDILKTDKIQRMAEMDKKILALSDSDEIGFRSTCFSVGGECLKSSLFELWKFNYSITSQLTEEEVLNTLNQPPVIYNPNTNIPFSIGSVLGEVKEANGSVVGAQAHLMRYFTIMKSEWENKFTEFGLQKFPDFDNVYVKGAQSEQIEFDKTFYSDIPLLIIGGALIFVYIIFMSGRWSLVGHRFWVAVASMASILLSLGLTVGLSASLLYPWSQLGLLAPFLLLGVGVDDMFVILRTWDNVESSSENRHLTVTEKAGLVLRLAGASITVTSMTDLVAFCIGISSNIPFLSSFCVTLSIGVISLFVMQVTFFFPALVIDERRKEKNHDGLLLGLRPHSPEYKENRFADLQLQRKFFVNVLSYATTSSVLKALIMIVTLGVAATMAYGVSNLNYDYDIDWFIDSESYLSDYYKAAKKYFAEEQTLTSINVIGGDFYKDRMKILELKNSIESNQYIINGSCYGWFDEFLVTSAANGIDVSNESSFSNQLEYYNAVKSFIISHPILQTDVRFADDVITATRFTCKQIPVDLQSDALPGMISIRDTCSNFVWNGTEIFSISEDYVSLESILIVKSEIFINLGLTFAAVSVIILFLISSLQTCFWVIMSVFLTILDVGGVMYYWGLTIEAGTMVCLILAIGLAVDYSSHIGYKFMIYAGEKSQRAKAALINIGPAVFNGGFSTFIPIVMLAGSNIYVTNAFFKIFFSVVLFGLWHSLIFLPAILSLIGPPPYKSAYLLP